MMGYRSAVEAVFYTRNEEEWPILKLYIDENFPKCWRDEDIEYLKPIKASNAWGYHFIADNIKWYESYPEIQEFNEFAEKFVVFSESKEGMPEKQLSWAYEFVRLGEEANDIEEERSDNADFILCVRREIELLP
jgi:hypothetical protein